MDCLAINAAAGERHDSGGISNVTVRFFVLSLSRVSNVILILSDPFSKTRYLMRANNMEILMQLRLRVVTLAALAASLAGCVAQKPIVYQDEKFDTTSIYTHRFPVASEAACEAARRTLLSQGYVINSATSRQIDGSKSFQPDTDVHVQISFRVVCADDPAHPGEEQAASVFVNALEDRYALKKVNNSASLGVGALGSLSVPFASSDDSLVKVASQTIEAKDFYARFFQLLQRYLVNDRAQISSPAELPANPDGAKPNGKPLP